jgi:chemotaxis signal transduction protein
MSDEGAIDWAAARARLDQARRALEAGDDIRGDRARDLLRARAAALAETLAGAPARGEGLRLLVLAAGGERYGIPIGDIAGLVALGACTRAPRGPAALLGFATARGRIWSVFDFARLLGSTPQAAPAGGYLVMLRHAHRRVGLRFDAAETMRFVRRRDIRPAPESGAPARAGLVAGLGPGGLIIAEPDGIWTHPAIGEAR